MRRISTTVAIVALMSAAACSSGKTPATTPSTAPSTAPVVFSVTGGLTLGVGDFMWDSGRNACWGDGGYADMKLGAQVVVSDSAGATIAVGSVNQAAPYVPTGETTARGCDLSFMVEGVPAGKGFYGVEVSHRGRLQYPEDQIRQDLKLTLG